MSEFTKFIHCPKCEELIDWGKAPPLSRESIKQNHYLDIGTETWMYKCKCGHVMGGFRDEIPIEAII